MSTFVQWRCTQTLSVSVITSWFLLKRGWLTESQMRTTSAMTPLFSWRNMPSMSSGLVSSRNTRSWITRAGHMAGRRMDTPPLRVPTTVATVPARSSVGTLLMLITKPAYTLVSTFPEPTLRSCPASGSIRSVHVPAFPVSLTENELYTQARYPNRRLFSGR